MQPNKKGATSCTETTVQTINPAIEKLTSDDFLLRSLRIQIVNMNGKSRIFTKKER